LYVGVTAAGGQTGRYVVRELARRGLRTRGLVHSAGSDEAALKAGASDTARIDLDDPASLTPALRDLTTLVFIAPPFDASEESHAAHALKAASAQHISHFVYYSVLHAHLPGVPHHLRKRNVEAQVREAPLSWTTIQPTMYQQTLLALVDSASDGVVGIPWNPAAHFNLVDLADVAEAVGRVITAPALHAYASYELGGPERLTTEEMLNRIAEATARELRLEELPSSRPPLPPSVSRRTAAEMVAMFAKYDAGYPANPNVLRYLLDREPTSLASTARRELGTEPSTGRPKRI
jgi:uncharacterized protein YbjT (DUF2867 family)